MNTSQAAWIAFLPPDGIFSRDRWKDLPKRDRSHFGAYYALVVSIETEATDVDIWTPVAQEIGVPVDTVVEI